MKIYGIQAPSLKEFKTNTKNACFDVEPAAKFRLLDEEIKPKGGEEQGPNEDQDEQKPDNFKFENRLSISKKGPKAVKVAQINLIDNLQDHLDQLEIEDDEFQQQSNNFNKEQNQRRVTLEEKNEFRGTSLVKQKTIKKDEPEVVFTDFNLLMVLGRGAFGKVFLAELKKTKQLFAVKSIRKDILIEMDQVTSTLLEKEIMFECDHPFLVGMEYLFQNDMRLYFVMPFIRGGELYKIYQAQKRFEEPQVKFYIAQMIMAIGYLHSKGIVHRDLKLENVLVDQKGYIKIIDYGLAKMLKDNEEATSFCGTPEYLAPEMVTQEGHDKAVDWWAIGVLMYEMLIGVTPFFNKNKNMLLTKIKQSKVIFPDRKKYKIDYSDDLMDLIIKLLDKDKATRLGSKGDAEEILSHPFFKDLNL